MGQLTAPLLRSTCNAEEPQNAWLNLAFFYGRQNDFPHTEQALRAAIQAAPNWYKPHWTLAQLLVKEGRLADARREAEVAVAANPRMSQVLRTLENIRGLERQ